MKNISTQFLFTLVLIVSFYYLAAERNRDWIEQFDRTIIRVVQGWESPWLTDVMRTITELGWGIPAILFSIGMLFYLLIVFNDRKQAVLFAVVMIGTPLLNRLLKNLFQRERPTLDDEMQVNGYSFPSGHTMVTVSFFAIVVFILWQHMKRPSRVLLLLFSVFMIGMIGLSRIYLEVHYPSDIIGGFLASGIWVSLAIGVHRISQKLEESKQI